jgi:hypothetical protein
LLSFLVRRTSQPNIMGVAFATKYWGTNGLFEYNSNTRRLMKLVTFLDPVRHICHIARFITQNVDNVQLIARKDLFSYPV